MTDNLKIAILELYCGDSGKLGFYNSQEIGLAKAYAKQGNEVLIVYPQKGTGKRRFQKITEKVMVLYIPAKAFGVHSYYKLDFLLEYQIGLVHLDADNQAYAPHVMKFCKKHGISFYNYVGTVYSDTDHPLKKLILDRFSKRNLRYFKKTKTFVKTEAVLKELKRNGVDHAKVVPVGLDLEVIPPVLGTKMQLRQMLGLPEDKKLLIFVGRLSAYKRPADALELLRRLGKEYHLLIIGKGELQKEIREKIQVGDLKAQVTSIASVPNTEIHKYYRASDCFVNFNEHEIFGMSILEAMYQECPVVARHAPGPDAIVEAGITGYLCRSVAEMAEKIPFVEQSMGIAGKERVEKEFSWDTAVQRFQEDT